MILIKKSGFCNVLFLFISFIILFSTLAYGKILRIITNEKNETIIVINNKIHSDYGFAYPLTYEFSLPSGSSNTKVFMRYAYSGEWKTIVEKTSNDFFNEIQAFRINPAENKIYISTGFSNISDSIFLKVTNEAGIIIPVIFNKICKFYDNRGGAVTLSADDMAGWSKTKFEQTLNKTRSLRLWVTCGINTGGEKAATYKYIQAQLDSGYVEASAHSRTHPPSRPYADPVSEITGCKDDIINNLKMPEIFRNGNKQYVYVYIAPNGYTNNIIDSLCGVNKYIVNRLYSRGFQDFTLWNDSRQIYTPIRVTMELGPNPSRISWTIASDDTNYLRKSFDDAISAYGIYNLMFHPNILEWDSAYTFSHLKYISNRNNIWYTGLGPLFLYHLAQENYEAITNINDKIIVPTKFNLSHNYPNPFNPSTSIKYQLPEKGFVNLSIFNSLGEIIDIPVNSEQSAGVHIITWDAKQYSSGIYFYRLSYGSYYESRKMLLIK